MTSMPTINDRMVDEFRRTGKRRASYLRTRSSRSVRSASRVVPQQSDECMHKPVGAACGCNPTTGMCLGECGPDHQCWPQ